jgi:hypothetical protein
MPSAIREVAAVDAVDSPAEDTEQPPFFVGGKTDDEDDVDDDDGDKDCDGAVVASLSNSDKSKSRPIFLKNPVVDSACTSFKMTRKDTHREAFLAYCSGDVLSGISTGVSRGDWVWIAFFVLIKKFRQRIIVELLISLWVRREKLHSNERKWYPFVWYRALRIETVRMLGFRIIFHEVILQLDT